MTSTNATKSLEAVHTLNEGDPTSSRERGLVHAPQTARDDWPAQSDAMRRIGTLSPGKPDPASIRAASIFGFDAIMRPTWIYVARTEGSMSTSARYFPQRWKRLKNRARPNLGRPLYASAR